jgi:adenine C2-methylase RlmN of 23S rRNA A2503 and tRNA A37
MLPPVDNVDNVDNIVDVVYKKLSHDGGMKGSKKMTVLSTRVDEDIAAKLKKLADAKEWTSSKYIEKVLRAHVEAEEAKKKPRGAK